MPQTKIVSATVYPFTQPSVGSTVVVRIITVLEWLKADVNVYLIGGGLYRVISVVGVMYTMELITPEVAPGLMVTTQSIYPTDPFHGDMVWTGIQW